MAELMGSGQRIIIRLLSRLLLILVPLFFMGFTAVIDRIDDDSN